jgi:hypothetical protein
LNNGLVDDISKSTNLAFASSLEFAQQAMKEPALYLFVYFGSFFPTYIKQKKVKPSS